MLLFWILTRNAIYATYRGGLERERSGDKLYIKYFKIPPVSTKKNEASLLLRSLCVDNRFVGVHHEEGRHNHPGKSGHAGDD